MKETSGLEVDAVLGSSPYLKGVGRRKTIETVTKSEDMTKEKKKPKRTVADMNDLYERYYLQEKPGRRQHKEELDKCPQCGNKDINPDFGCEQCGYRGKEEEQGGFEDILSTIKERLTREFKATPQQIEYAIQLMTEDFLNQMSNYGEGQGYPKAVKTLGMITSGEIVMPGAEQQSTQDIRRSRGDFENDIELANIVNKTMKEKTESEFESNEELAQVVDDTMKSEESPILQWTQSVDPERGAFEEYHTPFNNGLMKATIRFYAKAQKSKDHYAVQFEHDGLIFSKDFETLMDSRNYLKEQREYDIKKYYGLRETEKPISALHVLHDAYKKQFDAATDEHRKTNLENKLKEIRNRLGMDDKLKQEETKQVEKTFVDDVAPTSWNELNTITKMSTYKMDYAKLIEHGIYDKDHNLADLESVNEYGEYYTREGEKIPSDDIKAVREILATGIYSVTGLKHRSFVGV